ncbi:Uncharacterized protein FWK35_00028844 [Aphis craccivora]|uniref:Uncharacterized protein n=1 Tax=Aphis craccivora TaxID=307492 RepID=A0A6G0YNV7_APHCR|nr:Uncharacterized protein FWK35_00028844 [Aphis craccivora]
MSVFFLIFFLCVTTFWSSKSASIFKLSPVSDRKANLVGTFGRSFFEILNSFQKNREKKNNNGKTGIFTQNQFLTKPIFLYVCNSKAYHCKYLKFSLNIYINFIYIQLNFQNILTFFELFIDH